MFAFVIVSAHAYSRAAAVPACQDRASSDSMCGWSLLQKEFRTSRLASSMSPVTDIVTIDTDSSGCPPGRGLTKLECEVVAEKEGVRFKAKSWAKRPTGCFTGGDKNQIFFNDVEGGRAHSEYAPVCKDARPQTVFWDPDTLLEVQTQVSQDRMPSEVSTALSYLLRKADEKISFPPGRGVIFSGPWSPTNKSALPPSNDKRDYFSTALYTWPCDMSCSEAAAQKGSKFSAEECKDWPTKVYDEPCDDDGKPWVAHDGFANKCCQEDADLLILTMDYVEQLALAWWYSQDAKYAEAAMRLLRTYLLDTETGLRPQFFFSEGVPGYVDGKASGLEVATHRMGSRLPDSVALLKRSPVWTGVDGDRWAAWAQAWLEHLHTSEFGTWVEKLADNNHATMLFKHKLAMAYAVGDSSKGLQLLASLRSGLAGSLTNQIAADGTMPHELRRTLGATYTRMNLEGLFFLGVVADTCCKAWGCNSSLMWNWTWSAPASTSGSSWKAYLGKVSKCKWVQNLKKPGGLGECKDACSKDGMNAFYTRTKGTSLMECVCRRCPAGSDGMLVDQEEQDPTGANRFDTYILEVPLAEGAGSVKKALDYVIPFALGQKKWRDSWPYTLVSDEAKSWKALAPILRLASIKYGDEAYEDVIPQLEDEFALKWASDVFNLIFPASP